MKGQGVVSLVRYKGTTDDFIVHIDDVEEYNKFKAEKIAFNWAIIDGKEKECIHVTNNHGSQGEAATPSNGQLENEFGTHNVEECLNKILREGILQETTMATEKQGSKNESMGSRNAF